VDEYLARAVYEHMQLNEKEVHDLKHESFPSYLLIRYWHLSITVVLDFDSASIPFFSHCYPNMLFLLPISASVSVT